MTEFTLDTSGEVRTTDGSLIGNTSTCRVAFEDLSLFAQGYVEAALRSARWDIGTAIYYSSDQREWRDASFSDLAPETLAAMLKDCEEIGHGIGKFYADTHRQGGHFWDDRDHGTFKRLPPLTLYIGDDGRVYQKETN